MLVAETLDHERVIACDAIRGVDYYCPECRSPVLLRSGMVKVPHFAHKPEQSCGYDAGETDLHRTAKLQMYRTLQALELAGAVSTVEIEHRIGRRRADLVFCIGSQTVAVEVQASSIGVDLLLKRTIDYSQAGAAVLWLLPSWRPVTSEISIRSLHKTIHTMYFGGCFYWYISDPLRLHFVHFSDAIGARGRRLRTRRAVFGDYPTSLLELRVLRREEFRTNELTIPACSIVCPPRSIYDSIRDNKQHERERIIAAMEARIF